MRSADDDTVDLTTQNVHTARGWREPRKLKVPKMPKTRRAVHFKLDSHFLKLQFVVFEDFNTIHILFNVFSELSLSMYDAVKLNMI